LGRLALGGQVQPERADLRGERPGVQRLAPPPAGLRDGHCFSLFLRFRSCARFRSGAFPQVRELKNQRAQRHRNPSLPAVCAGERADQATWNRWSGAGSNYRPSAFQLDTSQLWTCVAFVLGSETQTTWGFRRADPGFPSAWTQAPTRAITPRVTCSPAPTGPPGRSYSSGLAYCPVVPLGFWVEEERDDAVNEDAV